MMPLPRRGVRVASMRTGADLLDPLPPRAVASDPEPHLLSLASTSPKSSQVSPLKRAILTAWIG